MINGQDLELFQHKKLIQQMLSVYLNYLYLHLTYMPPVNQEDHYLVYNTVIQLTQLLPMVEMLPNLDKVDLILWSEKDVEV